MVGVGFSHTIVYTVTYEFPTCVFIVSFLVQTDHRLVRVQEGREGRETRNGSRENARRAETPLPRRQTQSGERERKREREREREIERE